MTYSNMDNVPTQAAGTSELLASDWNTYVRDNFDALKYGHLVFASSSARASNIGAPVAGIMTFLEDSASFEVYRSGGWSAAMNTASIVDLAVTTGKIADNAVSNAKLRDSAGFSVIGKTGTGSGDPADIVAGADSVLRRSGSGNLEFGTIVTNNIADANVTYAKLAADVKTFDVPTSGTGVYFTSSGDFTSASLSTASAQNPVVIANHASTTIELSLPNTVGTEGATITVCQTGAATTVIKPKTGATATINGSTSNTYTLSAQYSVVTLLCLSNSGSNGTWVITGDYI